MKEMIMVSTCCRHFYYKTELDENLITTTSNAKALKFKDSNEIEKTIDTLKRKYPEYKYKSVNYK